MEMIDKLPSPCELKEVLRPGTAAIAAKAARDAEIASIIAGVAPCRPKLLMIIGPCSAHCPDAVLEYTLLLAATAGEVASKMVIVPRVYTAKPRSATRGYMGLIHEKGGLLAARKLHLDVLEQTGLSTADELLYPALLPYFDDLVSYFAVGARSVRNQEHRLVASGIAAPVGMKNPLCGDLSAMEAAVRAAQSPHRFIFRNAFVRTKGNALAHGVLRGMDAAPNHHKASTMAAPVIIDCSHGNSGKNPLKQRDVALASIKMPNVRGLMIESFTHEGQSITDPCLCWPKTKELIYEIAENWKI